MRENPNDHHLARGFAIFTHSLDRKYPEVFQSLMIHPAAIDFCHGPLIYYFLCRCLVRCTLSYGLCSMQKKNGAVTKPACWPTYRIHAGNVRYLFGFNMISIGILPPRRKTGNKSSNRANRLREGRTS